MNSIVVLLFFIAAPLVSFAQCWSVGIQVSSSDTSIIQLYHAGFFNIPSGIDNVCDWEVKSLDGEIIHSETTSGEFLEQSGITFDHSIPTTDSMHVSLVITNETAGIICTINDTLFWREIEVLPGAFIGNWDVLSGNGGVEEEITSVQFESKNTTIEIFPSPVIEHFQIKGRPKVYSFTIFNRMGKRIKNYDRVQSNVRVDVSSFDPGVYFVQFYSADRKSLGVIKMLKQ